MGNKKNIRTINAEINKKTFYPSLKKGTFKKYVCSRFPSFEPPPPLFTLVHF